MLCSLFFRYAPSEKPIGTKLSTTEPTILETGSTLRGVLDQKRLRTP